MRRGIDFAQAELATKVRGKYLRALEEEQFDVLPAQTYVKGFLRTYAEYLGLDGQLYVDEYNSRFVGAGDEHEPRTRRSAARPQQRATGGSRRTSCSSRSPRSRSSWSSSSPRGRRATTRSPAPPQDAACGRQAPPRTGRPARRSPACAGRRMSQPGSGAPRGNVAFDGTICKGDSPVALRGQRLWLQIDSPENLRIQVRGKLVHVRGLKPRVIIVTPTGWRPA